MMFGSDLPLGVGPFMARKIVPLKPGEPTPSSKPFGLDPPDGWRLETDAEFRERIKEAYRLHGSPSKVT